MKHSFKVGDLVYYNLSCYKMGLVLRFYRRNVRRDSCIIAEIYWIGSGVIDYIKPKYLYKVYDVY